MDGSAVSRTLYAGLFAAIGTVFGAGDGSTTFNLPDARGRAVLGVDNMGGTAANRLTTGGSGVNGVALGAVGGGETVTLSTANIPPHTHAVQLNTAGSTTWVPGPASATGGNAAATGSSGSGGAHVNIPPALVLNKIIKT